MKNVILLTITQLLNYFVRHFIARVLHIEIVLSILAMDCDLISFILFDDLLVFKGPLIVVITEVSLI